MMLTVTATQQETSRLTCRAWGKFFWFCVRFFFYKLTNHNFSYLGSIPQVTTMRRPAHRSRDSHVEGHVGSRQGKFFFGFVSKLTNQILYILRIDTTYKWRQRVELHVEGTTTPRLKGLAAEIAQITFSVYWCPNQCRVCHDTHLAALLQASY